MLKNFKNKSKEKASTQDAAYEGQLAVDVYQTEKEIIIRAPIAGVSLDDLNISVTDDVITIRGERKLKEEISKKAYLSQECYWGPFSRAIILPDGIDKDGINAKFKEGILTIKVAKKAFQKKVEVAAD